jgi:hypothetical protein
METPGVVVMRSYSSSRRPGLSFFESLTPVVSKP